MGTALAKLWNITTTRRTGENDFKPIFAAFLEGLSIFPPDAVATACTVWPDLPRGEWWPSLKELQAIVREYLPPPEDNYQAAPPRAAPSPGERTRVQAGFDAAITGARPSRVNLTNRERPPPRYLTGHDLAEARKKAVKRLAEYGAQGGE